MGIGVPLDKGVVETMAEEFLSSNEQLRTLLLDNTDIDGESALKLFEAINEQDNLQKITLRNNPIPDEIKRRIKLDDEEDRFIF
mmetsp:Transcript_56421/g.64425  ORF Transcript_56421/g.64425 Transcript_56421/m.64425 type:complete len:84 (+) Transcript_56421:1390-1641(+)